MIQRIQSIFLFLSAACFGVLFSLPLMASDATTIQMLSDHLYDVQDHIALTVTTIITVLLALMTIFLYKNRKLQKRLTLILVLCSLVFVALAYFLIQQASGSGISSLGLQMRAGIFLPFVAIVFNLLASRYIGKDEKLVQSMNRLR